MISLFYYFLLFFAAAAGLLTGWIWLIFRLVKTNHGK